MKVATLMLVTLLAVGTLAAQEPAPPRAGDRMEQLARELDLNDTQKEQVKQIFAQQRSKLQAERAELKASGTQLTPDQRRAKMQELQQGLTQQLSGVLTPAQMQKFKQLEQQRAARMRQGNAPPPGQ
jgi:Spy/CpxP family protein refolding chaperone